MKNHILAIILLVMSFSLLNSFPFIYLNRISSWDPQSNGMGKSFLAASQINTCVLYNPAQLAEASQTEVGIYNRLNFGSYDYYIPMSEEPYWENTYKKKKSKIKPTFKLSALSTAFPIYQSQDFKIGMGLAYQNYSDYSKKIEIDEYHESTSKGGFNTLSSGFGISYKNSLNIGASYHNSFQSVYKDSYSISEKEIFNSHKSINGGNFVLLSGIYKFDDHTELSCSYKLYHTRYGSDMYGKECDILNFGFKKKFQESEYTFQASVPFYSKYYGYNDDGLTLNLGANYNLNRQLNLQVGSYYESIPLGNQFEAIYGFTTGLKMKSFIPVDLYVSLDYAFQNSTENLNVDEFDNQEHQSRTDLFTVYSGISYTFQKGK